MFLQYTKLFNALLVISIIFTFDRINAEIDDEKVKNSHGEVVFQVYDENRVKVPNRHRDKSPTLRFSFHGTTAENIEKGNDSAWTVLLGDKSTVDFIVQEKDNTSEVTVHWHGNPNAPNRELCFNYGHNQAYWFNAYQSPNGTWPMDTKRAIEKQQFNYLFDFDRIAHDRKVLSEYDYYYYYNNWNKQYHSREHIQVLEQLFLNSDGFAVLLDHHSPLFIRRAPNNVDPVMCFSANNIAPYMSSNNDTSYLDLKVYLFASANIRTVTDYVVHQSGHIPRPTEVPDEQMISQLTWFAREINITGQSDVTSFAHLFPSSANQQIVLSGWNANQIEAITQNDAYPEEGLISELHKRKFKVGLQFYQPTLTPHQLTSSYFLNQTDFVDFSQPGACQLLNSKFQNLRFEKQIDILHLTASINLTSTACHNSFYQKYPSLLATKYIETVSQVANTTIISEYAFKTQHLPVWVRLVGTLNYNMQNAISNALAVSIAGYSFIMPSSAGDFSAANGTSEHEFVRQIQLLALMPSMSFTKNLWDRGDYLTRMYKQYTALHNEHVPLMIELAKRRIRDGTPIIRPMWYAEPDDIRAFNTGAQFMLGDDIVVRPTYYFYDSYYVKSVYLPTGTWISPLFPGKEFKGPKDYYINELIADTSERYLEDKLLYFKRKI